MKNKILILSLVFALVFSVTAFADIENFAVTKTADTEYGITFNLPTDTDGAQVFVYGPVKGMYDSTISMNPTGEWKDYYVHYTRYIKAENSVVKADFKADIPAEVLVDVLYVSAVTADGSVYHISNDGIRKMPGVSSLKSLEIINSDGQVVADSITLGVPSTYVFKSKIVDAYDNLMTEAKTNFITEGLTSSTIQLIDSTVVVDDKAENSGVKFKVIASYDNLSDTVDITVSGSGSSSGGGSSGGGSSVNKSSGRGSSINAPSSMVTPGGESSIPFTDLSTDDWYYDNIMNLHSLGVFYGTDGKANPNSQVTVQEICAFLQRALKLDNDSATMGELANDATVSEWAKGPVSAAIKADILKGDGTGSFGGEKNSSREQAFVLLARAFGIVESEAELDFADASQVSDWARNYISAMVENGYVNGNNEGNIAPSNTITRAEFCAVLDRVLSK